MKPLIIGIDPGTTSAATGVDFNGDLEFMFSERHISTSDLIEKIIENGRPVIVTSDRAKTPSKVAKISSSLGAELYEPEKDLSQIEKAEMGSGENYHEKDASAAALNAYNKSRKEVRRIKKISETEDLDLLEASRKYYGGFSIERDDEEESSEETQGAEPEPEESIENRLRRKIKRLESEIDRIESEKESILDENSSLERKLENLREKSREEIETEELRKKEGIIEDKNSEIDRLEGLLKNSRKIIKAYRDGMQMLFEGSELIPVADEIEDVGEKAAFRSEDMDNRPEFKDTKMRDVEEIKGIELKDFIIAEEFPEKNFEDVIKDYKESR